MYPAKFTFDVTQTPSCANDYVVFPIAAQGSATQPNLVAFNNLYSGTGGGGTGYCNRTPSGSDLGTSGDCVVVLQRARNKRWGRGADVAR